MVFRCEWCGFEASAKAPPARWVEITAEGRHGLIFHGEACLEAWRRAHPGVMVERSPGELGDGSPW